MAAAGSKVTIDELARLGGGGDRTHQAIVEDARRAVVRLRESLDLWLRAIEDPLAPGAMEDAERLVLDVEGVAPAPELGGRSRSKAIGLELMNEAEGFVTEVHLGLAHLSWGEAEAPECPGEDMPPGMACGNPIAKGHALCLLCERHGAAVASPPITTPPPHAATGRPARQDLH